MRLPGHPALSLSWGFCSFVFLAAARWAVRGPRAWRSWFHVEKVGFRPFPVPSRGPVSNHAAGFPSVTRPQRRARFQDRQKNHSLILGF